MILGGMRLALGQAPMRPNLRVIVPSILSLTALLPSLAACSSETSMDSQVACPQTGDDRYKALSPSSDVDGINFYVRTSSAIPIGTSPVRLRMTLGSLCKRAKDAAACRAQVDAMAAAETNKGWTTEYAVGGDTTVLDFAIATRGDDVRLLGSPNDLAKAVVPIDSAEEALALVKLSYASTAVCNEPNVTTNAEGYVVKSIDGDGCGNESEILYTVTKDGSVRRGTSTSIASSSTPCTAGRQPAQLVVRSTPWLQDLATHFAEVSHLEAAAVLAFENMEAELREFGAPSALLRRVRKARADEVRHAESTRVLAERFGGTPREPRCAPHDARPSLLAFAIENAREGCIRETYGSLVAGYQAKHAKDVDVRAVLTAIAAEELEHATLSWDIAEWVEAKLTPAERALVERARHEAIEDLRASLREEPSREVKDVAGMPDAKTALALLDALAPNLLVAAA